MSKKRVSSSGNGINLLSIITFFVVGIGLGLLLANINPKDGNAEIRVLREGGYEYINPLLDTETISETNRSEYISLNKRLQGIVDSNIAEENATHISIYYKDLLSGGWIGINEKENFTPASLLKIGVMLTFYKMAESDPTLLSEEIEYKDVTGIIEQNVIPEESLEIGKSYTVDELIERMIIYSDNESLVLLVEKMDSSEAIDIYKDLGLEIPDDSTPEDFISPKDYASFFRILYNSSYLNRYYSSKALELLTRTTFDKGIRVGVPDDIKIAHKFGERGYTENDIKQMHDCGIVYHIEKPYILCVMTRGTEINSLEYIIQSISKEVYKSL